MSAQPHVRLRSAAAAATIAALCAVGLASASHASEPSDVDSNGRAIFVACPDGAGGATETGPLPGAQPGDCDSLAEALAAAAANNRADDIILLQPGYYCPVILPDTGNRLYLQGIPPEPPTIDDGGGAVAPYRSAVEAVTFAKYAKESCPSVAGNVVIGGGSGLTTVFLSNLAVDGNGSSGDTAENAVLYGIELIWGNALLRNVVVKRAQTGLRILGGTVMHSAFVKNVNAGVHTGENSPTWIQNSLIADTVAPGGAQGVGLLEGTMSNYAANADTLRNVTITGNEIGLGRVPGVSQTSTKVKNTLIAGNDLDCDYYNAGANSNSGYNAVSEGCFGLAGTAESETLSSSAINQIQNVEYVGGFQPYVDPRWESGARLGDPALCSLTDQLERLRTTCYIGAITPITTTTPPLVPPPVSTYIEYPPSLDFGPLEPGEPGFATAYLSNKRDGFVTVRQVSVSDGFAIHRDDCSLSFMPRYWITTGNTPQQYCTVTVTTDSSGPLAGMLTVATNRGVISIPLASDAVMLPLASATPTFSNTVKVGVGLTVVPGAWTAGTAFTYQWLRDGAAISGATKASYAPVAADRGKKLSVTVTGTKAGYTTESKTSAAKTVGYGTLTTAAPTVTGTVKVGSSVKAAPGAWTAGTTFAYQWLRDGAAISGATKASYTPVAGDRGKKLSVKVTGTKAGYTAASKTSAAKTVGYGTLKTAAPQVTGTVKVGSAVKAVPGAWTTGTSFTYQWLRDGKSIAKATKASYTPVAGDRGKKLSVKVTGTKAGYAAASKVSAAKTVGYGTLTTATPIISGTAKVGKTLTAKPGTWKAGTKKPALTYQWYASGKAISGATKATYKLKAAQVGKTITVKVKGTAAGYATVTKTSKATAKVKR